MTTTLLTRLLLPLLAVAALAGILRVEALQSTEQTLEILAIDTDVAGNSSSAVGDIQVCGELAVGEELEVDVVVKGIPALNGPGGELIAFQFTIFYDERYVEIIAADLEDQLIGRDPGSNPIDFTDTVPSNDGSFTVAVADFGTDSDESGDGVLVRLTLRGVEAGTTHLAFIDEIIFQDSVNAYYPIATLQNALIAVGVGCAEGATPPPPPSGSPPRVGPGGPGDPGESPGPDDTPGEDPTPGETDNGGPSPSAGDESPGTSPTTSPGGPGGGDPNEDDDGDSGGTLIIIAAVVVAVLAAMAAAGYFILRRQGGAAA